MQSNSTDILIIGAGLTGLTLAYLLRDSGYSITLLEGRDRRGGRIQTIYTDGQAPREMGATWLGKKHLALAALLEELGLKTFIQRLGETAIYEPLSTSPPQLVRLPANEEPSYRIQGGSSQLIETLWANMGEAKLLLDHRVTAVKQNGEQLKVMTETGSFYANYVVSTLPPYLLYRTVTIEPTLPQELTKIMAQTYTWMGESIKVSFTYAEPFWRDAGLSGTIFSNVGPIPEMYDHTNVEDDRYALKGFFNGAYHSLSQAERLEMSLQQLEKYYGPKVRDYLNYDELIWAREPYTHQPYGSHVLPHQHNGHPIFRGPLLDGRFFVAGAETAQDHPGYMDGAVSSARFVARQIPSKS